MSGTQGPHTHWGRRRPPLSKHAQTEEEGGWRLDPIKMRRQGIDGAQLTCAMDATLFASAASAALLPLCVRKQWVVFCV